VNVGFLLTVGPDHPRFTACLQSLEAATQAGEEVFFYFLDDGITAATDPRIVGKSGPKFHLLGCAYAAEQRHLPRSPEVTYGGLKMLGDLIAHTSRFEAF
jgi:hypothetical protein